MGHDDETVHGLLKLSYDNLKSQSTKLCFLLCSLFQEDSEIYVENLVGFVVGLGLFQDVETVDETRDCIKMMIDELKASTLLLDTGTKCYVTMNDVARNVALNIASEGEHVFVLKTAADSGVWPETDHRLKSCKAISLLSHHIDQLPCDVMLPNLKVFLSDNSDGCVRFLGTFSKRMEGLQVLYLNSRINENLVLSEPRFLGFLINLRTLCLRNCKIPGDISILGKLKILEVLIISGISELPNELEELGNLRLLDLLGCRLQRIPPNVIGKLSKLEELYVAFSKEDSEWIYDLSSLSRLSILYLGMMAGCCLSEHFKFPKLSKYFIEVGYAYPPKSYPTKRKLYVEDEDAHSLSPYTALLPRLQHLTLKTMTIGLPNIIPYICSSGINELISLYIKDCSGLDCIIDLSDSLLDQSKVLSRLEDLELFEAAPSCICRGPGQQVCFDNLRVLRVSFCYNLKSLFSWSVIQNLGKLEILVLFDCQALEQIFTEEYLLAEEHFQPLCFPKLIKLKVDGSKYLKSILPVSFAAAGSPTLEKLTVSDVAQLIQIFGAENMNEVTEYRGQNLLLRVKKLKLDRLPNLCSIFPETLFSLWSSLEDLRLSRCPTITMLESFICKNPLQFGLSHLTNLEVFECAKMRCLLTDGLAQSLVRLKSLSITRCEKLVEIFTNDVEDATNRKELVLPELSELYLKQLSSLIRLEYAPHLSELTVVECPKMETNFACHSTLKVQGEVKVKSIEEAILVPSDAQTLIVKEPINS